MADRTGQQFGNYRLVALLGTGSFAEVYLGHHVRFNQQAAIKVLHAHLSGQEAEHFQHEAETIATLAHPAIVRVFDFDVQEGVPFLVMEYAPNGSLRPTSIFSGLTSRWMNLWSWAYCKPLATCLTAETIWGNGTTVPLG